MAVILGIFYFFSVGYSIYCDAAALLFNILHSLSKKNAYCCFPIHITMTTNSYYTFVLRSENFTLFS